MKKPTAQRSILAQWREGVVGRCHFPWLTLRRMAFVLASAVPVCGFVAEASIPLTVKCRCERADADRDIGSKTETLWVFVLDHSGSMGNSRDAYSIKRGTGCVLRWTALKDSFEETVRSIPIGASVQIYCVGGVSRGFLGTDGWDGARSHRVYQNPVKIQNSSDRDKLVSEVESWGRPAGGTPLYIIRSELTLALISPTFSQKCTNCFSQRSPIWI